MSTLLNDGIVASQRKLSRAHHHKKKKPLITYLTQDKQRNVPFTKSVQLQVQQKLALLNIRQQQLQEINGDKYEMSTAEKRMDQNLTVALVNVGLVGLSLFFPPLIWLTIPGLIYNYIPIHRLATKAIFKDRRVSAYMLDAMLMGGMIVGGYFSAAVLGALFLAGGQKLLLKSENHSKQNLMNLFSDQPRTVWVVVENGVELEIPFETLQLGDVIIITAGQTIPVDGVIIFGFAAIDQHKLTGEAQPAEKGLGDAVLASTIVLTGRIHIQTEKTGQETVANQIGVILNQTSDYKNLVQSRGEDIADKLTVPTLGASLLSIPLLGPSAALALLTNKMGGKMRILAPASMLTFLNIASQQGILVKDGRSLDILNQVDTIVFDKTGTLTLEQPTIGEIYAYKGVGQVEVLQYAAAAETGQTHPIAKAILTEAKTRKIQWPKIIDARYEMGYGIQVDLSDRSVWVGSHKFMALEGIAIPAEISLVQEACQQQGSSLVMVACNNQLIGAIELQATVRPEAKALIKDLRQRNMSIYIISGDQEAPTKKSAKMLEVDHYFANVLPEKKADLVETLQNEGRTVCFIGDGINDSIALKKANVSISLSGATTIALDTAQIVFMDGTLNQLGKLLDIVQEFEVNMKNNLIISTIPTIVCVAGVLFFQWGVLAGRIIGSSIMCIGAGNITWPLLTNYRQHEQSSS